MVRHTAVRRQLAGDGLHGLDAAPFGQRQHSALDGVGSQGDVVVTARPRGFVDGTLVVPRSDTLTRARSAC